MCLCRCLNHLKVWFTPMTKVFHQGFLVISLPSVRFFCQCENFLINLRMSYMKPCLCADSRSAAQNIKRLFSQLGITTVKICSEVSEHHDQDAGSQWRQPAAQSLQLSGLISSVCVNLCVHVLDARPGFDSPVTTRSVWTWQESPRGVATHSLRDD